MAKKLQRQEQRQGACDQFRENGGTVNGQKDREEYEIRTQGKRILLGSIAEYRGDFALYVKHKSTEDFITLTEIVDQCKNVGGKRRVHDRRRSSR